MSGGKYNYLCYKEATELYEYANITTLEEMERRFIELNYDDVARDFRRLVEYIKSANNRVVVLAEQLRALMRAIEWFDSADIGKESLDERVENYRNERG